MNITCCPEKKEKRDIHLSDCTVKRDRAVQKAERGAGTVISHRLRLFHKADRTYLRSLSAYHAFTKRMNSLTARDMDRFSRYMK